MDTQSNTKTDRIVHLMVATNLSHNGDFCLNGGVFMAVAAARIQPRPTRMACGIHNAHIQFACRLKRELRMVTELEVWPTLGSGASLTHEYPHFQIVDTPYNVAVSKDSLKHMGTSVLRSLKDMQDGTLALCDELAAEALFRSTDLKRPSGKLVGKILSIKILADDTMEQL